MPGLIGISEFVDEAMDDYKSPTTSTFVEKMPQCRQTISELEDVSCDYKPKIKFKTITHYCNLFRCLDFIRLT